MHNFLNLHQEVGKNNAQESYSFTLGTWSKAPWSCLVFFKWLRMLSLGINTSLVTHCRNPLLCDIVSFFFPLLVLPKRSFTKMRVAGTPHLCVHPVVVCFAKTSVYITASSMISPDQFSNGIVVININEAVTQWRRKRRCYSTMILFYSLYWIVLKWRVLQEYSICLIMSNLKRHSILSWKLFLRENKHV